MLEVGHLLDISHCLGEISFLGKFTDCKGKVVVRDINDNTPEFEHPEYLLEIEEEKTVKQKLEVNIPFIPKLCTI